MRYNDDQQLLEQLKELPSFDLSEKERQEMFIEIQNQLVDSCKRRVSKKILISSVMTVAAVIAFAIGLLHYNGEFGFDRKGPSLIQGTSVNALYPEVVAWNGFIYGLSVETVPVDQLAAEIGQIKRFIKLMPKQNGDSNSVPEGSQLYEIKDVDQQIAIAVKINDKYNKAYKIGPLQ